MARLFRQKRKEKDAKNEAGSSLKSRKSQAVVENTCDD